MVAVETALTELSEGRARAIAFLIDAYEGVRTAPGKGLPHAQAVADILRDAGYDLQVQVVGLLHDVVEDTPRSSRTSTRTSASRPLRWSQRSPKTTASATTPAQTGAESASDRRRPEVMAIALADKIASLQHARITATRVRKRKLAHYDALLQLAVAAGADGELCRRVAQLLHPGVEPPEFA